MQSCQGSDLFGKTYHAGKKSRKLEGFKFQLSNNGELMYRQLLKEKVVF